MSCSRCSISLPNQRRVPHFIAGHMRHSLARQANSHSQYSSPSARHLWSLMVAKFMPWIFSGIAAMPALADWQIIQAEDFRYGPNCSCSLSDNLIRMTALRSVTESTSKNSDPFAYFSPKRGNILKIWETEKGLANTWMMGGMSFSRPRLNWKCGSPERSEQVLPRNMTNS